MSVCVDLSGLSSVEILDLCEHFSYGMFDFEQFTFFNDVNYYYCDNSMYVFDFEDKFYIDNEDEFMSVSEYLELPTLRYVEKSLNENRLTINDSSGLLVGAYVGSVNKAVMIDNLYFEEKAHAIQTLREIADWLEG